MTGSAEFYSAEEDDLLVKLQGRSLPMLCQTLPHRGRASIRNRYRRLMRKGLITQPMGKAGKFARHRKLTSGHLWTILTHLDDPDWSNSAYARSIGVDQATVAKQRRKMEDHGWSSPIYWTTCPECGQPSISRTPVHKAVRHRDCGREQRRRTVGQGATIVVSGRYGLPWSAEEDAYLIAHQWDTVRQRADHLERPIEGTKYRIAQLRKSGQLPAERPPRPEPDSIAPTPPRLPAPSNQQRQATTERQAREIGSPWYAEDDRQLREWFEAGMPAYEIAERMQRTLKGVQIRIARLQEHGQIRHRRKGQILT